MGGQCQEMVWIHHDGCTVEKKKGTEEVEGPLQPTFHGEAA